MGKLGYKIETKVDEEWPGTKTFKDKTPGNHTFDVRVERWNGDKKLILKLYKTEPFKNDNDVNRFMTKIKVHAKK